MTWNITTSRVVTPDLEVLRHQVNAEVTASIVIDASTVAPGSDGVRMLVAGTPMVKNSNNQYQKYQATASYVNQTLAINATGGTFTLTKGAQTTANIAYNGDAALIKTRLEALSTVGTVEVTGAGTALDPFIITFQDQSEAAAITSTATNLTGGAGTATVGGSTLGAIVGILCRTEVFPDGTSKSDLPSAVWCHGQWFRPDRIVGWGSDQTAIKAALPTCKFS